MPRGLSDLQMEIIVKTWVRGGLAMVGDLVLELEPTVKSLKRPIYVRIHATVSRSISRLTDRGLARVFKDVGGGPGTAFGFDPPGPRMEPVAFGESKSEGSR